MNSKKKDQYVDSAGFIHYMPENTAIPISEAARIYNVREHETGKTYTVKEEPDNNKTVPKTVKEKSTDELIEEVKLLEEAKKYFPQLNKNKKEPEPKQQPNINEIKRLSRLLQDYRFG